MHVRMPLKFGVCKIFVMILKVSYAQGCNYLLKKIQNSCEILLELKFTSAFYFNIF